MEGHDYIMIVLGVETSCDDTAIAVVRNGHEILSSVVSSQDSLHEPYGGIVPEVASRHHLEMVPDVFEHALERAGITVREIDAIGVTFGPGLLGSLLVGLCFARSLAWSLNIPLIPVNHHRAHFYGAFLRTDSGIHDFSSAPSPGFPFIGLLVSGGHTALLSFHCHSECFMLGATRDDACGELMDKVARVLELGYPGGPAIQASAASGNRSAIDFPRPMLGKGLDFSFSGLKTAAVRYVMEKKAADGTLNVPNIAASLQEAAVDVLVSKTLAAVEKTGITTVVVSGGVAANRRLRNVLSETAEKRGLEVIFPEIRFCTDNGAMVAALASVLIENDSIPENAFVLDANPGAAILPRI